MSEKLTLEFVNALKEATNRLALIYNIISIYDKIMPILLSLTCVHNYLFLVSALSLDLLLPGICLWGCQPQKGY